MNKMTGCKELKERILKDPKYLAQIKQEEEDKRQDEQISKWLSEIESWFIELPIGRYRMYGKRSWFNDQIYTVTVYHKYSWSVIIDENEIKEVEMYDVRYTGYENLKWLIDNKEKVCKEIQFIG